jgi:hypothetical protein
MVEKLLKDPARVVSDLESVLPEIIRALEHGLQEARAYFDEKSVRFDASAFSVITRLHAREYLRQRSLEAADIDVERVNLCGLWLRLGTYQIKIWKIGQDELKKGLANEFYGNAQMEFDLDGERLLSLGLAVFWMADELRHLGDVYLVHQLRDDPRCFEWIWSQLIQHPAESISAPPERAGDLSIEEAEPQKNAK